MNKVVRVGTIPTWGGRRASVYIRIRTDSQFGNQDAYASFTGVVGPLMSGNCLGSCGQIGMGFAHRDPADNDARYPKPTSARAFNFAPGWNVTQWLDLLDMWKRWHMSTSPIALAIVAHFANTLPEADRQPAWA